MFDTLLVEPLAVKDVHRMLEERYRFLRGLTLPLDTVATAAVDTLHAMYRGDLRGLLKALGDGVEQLIGLTDFDMRAAGARGTRAIRVPRPMTLDELRPVLRQRYAAELATLAERTRVEQLSRWGNQAPDRSQTQKSLGALWKVSQGAVSMALTYLVERGYVVPLPRTAASPSQYVLSGSSRIIFG